MAMAAPLDADADTAPVKSLPAAVRLSAPAALSVVVPMTANAPVWLMPPPALTALSAPPTVAPPSTSAPVLASVRSPRLLTRPKVSAPPVPTVTAPPLAETGPVKRLSASVRVRLPLPASKLLLPVTCSAPVCVMFSLALATRRSPPTTRLPSRRDSALDRVKLPLLATVPRIRSLSSPSVTAPALAETAALKSLPAAFSTMAPLPACRWLMPVTTSSPLWPMSPLPLSRVKVPATALLAKLSGPALVSVRLPPTWASTETRPSASCR